MNTLHNKLLQKSKLYKAWHDSGMHALSHWVILVVAAIIAYFFLSGQIVHWSSQVNKGIVVRLPQAGGVVISLDPQTKTVAVGETLSADIILDTADRPIDGVDIYALHYDPTILQVIDDVPDKKGVQIEPGTIISMNAANIVDQKTGTIKFGQAAAGGTNFTGKGVLATIHFKAIGKGTTYLKFDFKSGSTVDTNAAHGGKDQLSRVVDAIYTVTSE